MVEKVKKTTVKGGYVARNAASGRLVCVGTSSGVSKSSEKTLSAIKGASEKRKAALKRLADR